MFFLSQTETEKNHIVAALVFELSKVETLAVRERVVSHWYMSTRVWQSVWPLGCASDTRSSPQQRPCRRGAK